MRLVDRIRELCRKAAEAKHPVTAFRALKELREIIREREFRDEMRVAIKEAGRDENERRAEFAATSREQ